MIEAANPKEENLMPIKWKPAKDPLFRGDFKEGVRPPAPKADDSVVRHILYLEGPGRETPYLSATESQEVAEYFAGPSGLVWQTMVNKLKEQGINHLSQADLLALLKKGNGKGKAKWDRAIGCAEERSASIANDAPPPSAHLSF